MDADQTAQLRLSCLELTLAGDSSYDPREIIPVAAQFADFVLFGRLPGTPKPEGNTVVDVSDVPDLVSEV